MQEFLDRFGKAAQQKASEAKMRLDIRGFNSKLDERAKELGHLMFRKHQGEVIADEDFDKLFAEMAEVLGEKKAKEAELEALHQPVVVAEVEATPVETESAPEAAVAPESPAAEETDAEKKPEAG